MRKLWGAGTGWMFDAGWGAQGPPPGLKHQPRCGCQPGFDPSYTVMQDLRHKTCSLSLCKSVFTAFSSLFLPFSSCVLSLAETHEAVLRGLMHLPEALLRWTSFLSSVSASP